jgi:uncharacterized protein DUF6916
MSRIGSLLLGAGGLLAIAALPAANVQADDANRHNVGEAELAAGLDQAKFEALLHQSFYVNSEHGVVILDLVEVQESKEQAKGSAHKEGRATEQFSITFLGPAWSVLPTGIYRLEHRLAGNAELYLEPMGADGPAMRYRARFVLLR